MLAVAVLAAADDLAPARRSGGEKMFRLFNPIATVHGVVFQFLR
jgi:hypothetical protein